MYEACVPTTAAYDCEITRDFQQIPQLYGALKLKLVTGHLQMLKEITGVRGSTSTNIPLEELGLSLPEVPAACAALTGCQILEQPG